MHSPGVAFNVADVFERPGETELQAVLQATLDLDPEQQAAFDDYLGPNTVREYLLHGQDETSEFIDNADYILYFDIHHSLFDIRYSYYSKRMNNTQVC